MPAAARPTRAPASICAWRAALLQADNVSIAKRTAPPFNRQLMLIGLNLLFELCFCRLCCALAGVESFPVNAQRLGARPALTGSLRLLCPVRGIHGPDGTCGVGRGRGFADDRGPIDPS